MQISHGSLNTSTTVKFSMYQKFTKMLKSIFYFFSGTCAFCERIYAVYSLEDNSECHTCYKTPSRFRHGCHSDQKDHLETADLAYLHTKLRDGLVPPALTHLLLALANQK